MTSKTTVKKAGTGKTRREESAKKNIRSAGKKSRAKTPAAPQAASTANDNEDLLLVLDPVLVVSKANELHRAFTTYINKKSDVLTIDASGVEMIDTAIIQLLYALVSGLSKNQASVVWQSPSAEFNDRVRSLGMERKLGMDTLAAG